MYTYDLSDEYLHVVIPVASQDLERSAIELLSFDCELGSAQIEILMSYGPDGIRQNSIELLGPILRNRNDKVIWGERSCRAQELHRGGFGHAPAAKSCQGSAWRGAVCHYDGEDQD